MALTICACVLPADVPATRSVVDEHLAGQTSSAIYGLSPDDFAAAKASGGPLVLLIESAKAHDVIKSLCDDHDKAERRVKFVYSISAGVDAYRLSELKQELNGIPFCNAQGCYSNILAEHVAFSMMYFNRSPWRCIASKHAHKWDRYNMVELRQQKAVVVGYGDIGQCCGQKAAALGMEVTGIRRSGDNKKDSNGVMVRGNDAFDSSVHEADFVIGSLPGTEHTKHFFNKEFFAKMKPSAVFINIGRGMTQCEADIVEALDKGTIRGAALDVFEVEPLPEDSPVWDVPDDKLLLTAHNADLTDKLIERSVQRFVGIFKDYVQHGKDTAYTVCTTKGY